MNNNNQSQKKDNILNKDITKNQNENSIQKIEKKTYNSDLKNITPNEENDNQYSSYLYNSMNNYKNINFNTGYSSNTGFQVPTKENDNKNETYQNVQYSFNPFRNYQGYSSSYNNQGGYY